MKIAYLIFFLLLGSTAGCDMLQPDETTDSSADAGDAASPTTCDTTGQGCASCAQCAGQSACAQVLSACTNDASCVGLDQCLALCGADLECKQQCELGNPVGVTAYDAMTRCLYCEQCPTTCAGYRPCGL